MAKIKDLEEKLEEYSKVSGEPADEPESAAEHSKRGWGTFVAAIIGAVVIVILLFIGYRWWSGESLSWFDSVKYQAVFLDNNQVYFGKLTRLDSNYPVLRDIYYLRLAQPIQPGNPNQIPDINLTKLGSELHGPEDEMKINREHILFIEDLKEDGQIMKAIKSFKEFQAKQQSQ